MVQPNWGLLQGGGGFQNALATGFQFGQQAKKQREEKEYKNALAQVYAPKTQPAPQGSPQVPAMGGSGIVATPEQRAESERLEQHFGVQGLTVDDRQPGLDPQALAVIAQRNPALAQRLQEQQAKQQEAAITSQLTQQAMSDDPAQRTAAMRQLATVNFDRWRVLGTEQKQAAEQEAEVFGNAAMDVLNRPPEQRPAAIMAYASRLQNDEIAQIAQLPPDQQEAALRAAIAEAGMVKELIAMEMPDYMAIPQGGTLVDTRNPGAVRQFGQGAPAPSVAPPPEAIAELRQNPGTAAQFDEIFGPGAAQRVLGNGGQMVAPSATFSGGVRGIPGERVTSTYRDPEHNKRVGGVRNSYHTRRDARGNPLARDSVPPPGVSMSAYAAELQRLNPHLEVINEGDHVHTEPRG